MMILALNGSPYWRFHVTSFDWGISILCSALLLFYINHVAVRWAMRVGEDALVRRMN
jgi:hypothetical protein